MYSFIHAFIYVFVRSFVRSFVRAKAKGPGPHWNVASGERPSTQAPHERQTTRFLIPRAQPEISMCVCVCLHLVQKAWGVFQIPFSWMGSCRMDLKTLAKTHNFLLFWALLLLLLVIAAAVFVCLLLLLLIFCCSSNWGITTIQGSVSTNFVLGQKVCKFFRELWVLGV